MVDFLCPCKSGTDYKLCCQPYHEGGIPLSCLHLMRARYSAYALGLVDFIIQTTHPDHPENKKALDKRKSEILNFSQNTLFINLEIVHFEENGNFGTVTFKAILKDKQQNDLSFTEKSTFEKLNGQWFYLRGVIG